MHSPASLPEEAAGGSGAGVMSVSGAGALVLATRVKVTKDSVDRSAAGDSELTSLVPATAVVPLLNGPGAPVATGCDSSAVAPGSKAGRTKRGLAAQRPARQASAAASEVSGLVERMVLPGFWRGEERESSRSLAKRRDGRPGVSIGSSRPLRCAGRN